MSWPIFGDYSCDPAGAEKMKAVHEPLPTQRWSNRCSFGGFGGEGYPGAGFEGVRRWVSRFDADGLGNQRVRRDIRWHSTVTSRPEQSGFDTQRINPTPVIGRSRPALASGFRRFAGGSASHWRRRGTWSQTNPHQRLMRRDDEPFLIFRGGVGKGVGAAASAPADRINRRIAGNLYGRC